MVPVNSVPIIIYSLKMEEGANNRLVKIEKNVYKMDNVSPARTIQEPSEKGTKSNNVPTIPAQPAREFS